MKHLGLWSIVSQFFRLIIVHTTWRGFSPFHYFSLAYMNMNMRREARIETETKEKELKFIQNCFFSFVWIGSTVGYSFILIIWTKVGFLFQSSRFRIIFIIDENFSASFSLKMNFMMVIIWKIWTILYKVLHLGLQNFGYRSFSKEKQKKYSLFGVSERSQNELHIE